MDFLRQFCCICLQRTCQLRRLNDVYDDYFKLGSSLQNLISTDVYNYGMICFKCVIHMGTVKRFHEQSLRVKELFGHYINELFSLDESKMKICIYHLKCEDKHILIDFIKFANNYLDKDIFGILYEIDEINLNTERKEVDRSHITVKNETVTTETDITNKRNPNIKEEVITNIKQEEDKNDTMGSENRTDKSSESIDNSVTNTTETEETDENVNLVDNIDQVVLSDDNVDIHNEPISTASTSQVTSQNSKKKIRRHFSCVECGQIFSRRTFYMQHKRAHEILKSPVDKPENNQPTNQLISKPKKKPKERFACDVCGRILTKLKNFVIHRRTHTKKQPYRCEVCGKHFIDNKTYIEHKNKHNTTKPFSCEDCDKTFLSRQALAYHQRLKEEVKCDVCDKVYPRHQCLLMHYRIHTSDGVLKCTVCHKICRTRTELIVHKRSHSGEKPFKCEICNKSFSQHHHYVEHKYRHTDLKSFKCNDCERTFLKYRSLLIHQKIRNDKPVPCLECGITFPRHQCLLGHNQKFHKFSCKKCATNFKNDTELEEHKENCTKIKAFQCEVCKKCFTQDSDCRRHKLIHTKKFPCKDCELIFPLYRDLKKHQYVHTPKPKVTIITCQICDKVFNNYSALYKHKKLHFDIDGKFNCAYCRRTFATKVQRDKHELRHRRKPDECELCKEQFIKRSDFLKHKKQVNCLEFIKWAQEHLPPKQNRYYEMK